MGIYVASKAKHGGDWKRMRDELIGTEVPELYQGEVA